jgi:hypothetical protein
LKVRQRLSINFVEVCMMFGFYLYPKACPGENFKHNDGLTKCPSIKRFSMLMYRKKGKL